MPGGGAGEVVAVDVPDRRPGRPERALRGAVRELQVEIREVEVADASDAGVIALPAE